MTAVDEEVWSQAAPLADLQAEASLLGSVLLSAGALGDVAATLTPEDFYRPQHAAVYAAALALYERGAPADAVTVGAELATTGELARVGGGPFLHSLLASTPNAGSVSWYARIVHDRAVARRLRAYGEHVAQLAAGPGDVADMLTDAERAFDRVLHRGHDTAVPVGDLIDPVLDDMDADTETVHGLPFGYRDLDLLVNVLEPGQMVVVGSRPGVGKSVFALDVCRHTAVRLGERALLITLEMGRAEVMRRLIAAEARVTLERIQRRHLDDDDWLRIAKARDRIAAAPLDVDDAHSHSLATLRAAIRRHRPRLVAVDYLQLLTTSKARDRREAVDELSRGLKLLAKAEQVPILVCSQLNRGAEARRDNRPGMADLRESGAIEQDADVVVLLHRPELATPEDRPGEVDLIVPKQRNGPTGSVTLSAQVHLSRFVDLAGGPW